MSDKTNQKDFEPWEILDRKMVFTAPPWFEVWRERVRLPDGRIIPGYYKLVAPDVAIVVAVAQEGKILVLRQYKHGMGGTVWELPAGLCDEHESALDCGQRELLEETGFKAEQWINLGNYVRDTNRGGGTISIFLASNAQKVTEPKNGDLEEYQVRCLTMRELLTLVRNQEIKAIGIVAAILLAHSHLEAERVAT